MSATTPSSIQRQVKLITMGVINKVVRCEVKILRLISKRKIKRLTVIISCTSIRSFTAGARQCQLSSGGVASHAAQADTVEREPSPVGMPLLSVSAPWARTANLF
ncbi:hypothetical protein SETIT_8G140300v2 [Setaria italica]|uniref:Uncharacterized protein n=1 Tax=Setaria italica TaxID=4555 RepID=A0A368S7Q8_SETIT|nr:hypothetical protein SETIT_8G140300v2 [Setaria italica]